MEIVNSLILTFLELTFVFVALLVLYGQRKNIGDAPFYVTLGILLIFGQMLCGADLRFASIDMGPLLLTFQIGPLVIFMPFLAAILMVYVTEGALATQRLIIGTLAAMGIFFYLGDLTRLQARWITYSVTGALPLEAFDMLLERSRRAMLAIVSGQVLELFLLPIVFSRLRNTGHRLFVCCVGALGIALVVDSLIYLGIVDITYGSWWNNLYPMLIVKAAAVVYLALLLTLYLAKFGAETEARHTRSLEIVFAFFGSYGRTKLLEANLLEWEGRYRMILENASEMIVIVDRSARILDANPASCRMLRLESDRLINADFAGLLHPNEAEQFRARFRELTGEPSGRAGISRRFTVSAPAENQTIHLALTITPLALGGLNAFIVMGRDITEEHNLEAERQRLNDELAHSQRLEALGQLAGGVAHDFNNNIHAILGHADLIALNSTLEESSRNHLEKIIDIAEQSGQLTAQLLGFARKGKYRESDFDLRILIRKSADIFLPGSKDIQLNVTTPDYPVLVRGDQIQLQQVVLNLLINARDALRDITDRDKIIEVRLEEAANLPDLALRIPAPGKEFHPENFWLLTISDNGCGMDENTRKRLFEPFFTTKPVGQGTGMGLAMAYGTVTNHRGLIHVESRPGVGTTLFILLPRLS